MISFRPPRDPAYYKDHPQLLAFNEQGQQFAIITEKDGRWLAHDISIMKIAEASSLWELIPLLESYLLV